MFLLADINELAHLKVAIFGIGVEAYFVNHYLERMSIDVECFLNNDIKMMENTFCGKKITILEKNAPNDYYIIVAMTREKYNNEVLWQLKAHGYEKVGLAFMEMYHFFTEKSLQDVVLQEINCILCNGKKFSEIARPLCNVGPDNMLLGGYSQLFWTTTWSHHLWDWFYIQYKDVKKEYDMLEIGPGVGLFSAVFYQINSNINAKWLMFEMDEQSVNPVKNKYTYYPACQFETYCGVIEEPAYEIDEKFDIIVMTMTEVLEHFVCNPIPTMKKIAKMLGGLGNFADNL